MGRSDVSFRANLHTERVAEIAYRLLELERASRKTMTAQERIDARTWYITQRLRLERIAVEADLPSGTVIAAAATLSPATAWGVVMRDLPGFIAASKTGVGAHPFATYGRQRYLASRIIFARLGIDSASGPKVGPFARALSGDDRAVMVDRHVARYSLGDTVPSWTGIGEVPRIAVRMSERKAIVDAHIVAGTALRIAPRDLQSLLWVARVGYDGDPGRASLKSSRGEVSP